MLYQLVGPLLLLVTVHGMQDGAASSLLEKDVGAPSQSPLERLRRAEDEGQLIIEPVAATSDIAGGAEGVVDESRFVWNRETLNELQPIFEAEALVQGGENQIVFLKWDTYSTRDLDSLCKCATQGTPVGDVDLKLWFQIPTGEWTEDHFRWTREQKNVWEYLQLKNNFIRVDVSSHISVKDSKIDIDLPLRCPLTAVLSSTRAVQPSVILRGVAHVHDEAATAVPPFLWNRESLRELQPEPGT